MNLWLAKHKRGFVTTDTDGEKVHARMAEGECALFKIIRPRSLKWHKMYYGICGQIGENQEPQRDADSIDYELRILAGHYTVMHIEGHEIRSPKRIAFDKLTHDEWANIWPKLSMAIAERFGEEYVRDAA